MRTTLLALTLGVSTLTSGASAADLLVDAGDGA